MGHVGFGRTSACSSPVGNLVQDYCGNPLVRMLGGRGGEMCISQRKEPKINSWGDRFIERAYQKLGLPVGD